MPAIFMFLLVGIILCLPANFFPCHTLRASVDVFPKQIGSREVFPPTAGGLFRDFEIYNVTKYGRNYIRQILKNFHRVCFNIGRFAFHSVNYQLNYGRIDWNKEKGMTRT